MVQCCQRLMIVSLKPKVIILRPNSKWKKNHPKSKGSQ